MGASVSVGNLATTFSFGRRGKPQITQIFWGQMFGFGGSAVADIRAPGFRISSSKKICVNLWLKNPAPLLQIAHEVPVFSEIRDPGPDRQTDG